MATIKSSIVVEDRASSVFARIHSGLSRTTSGFKSLNNEMSVAPTKAITNAEKLKDSALQTELAYQAELQVLKQVESETKKIIAAEGTKTARAQDMIASVREQRTLVGGLKSDYDKVSNGIRNANDNQERLNNKIKKGDTNAASLVKTIMGLSVIQKVVGMVNGSIDSAISRMDTLNNFPKVMSNLGIDKQQSQAAIQILSDGLKGLPTTLNDAASAVQRFTSSNNSIGYSTKMFLAVNNAILAGGQSMDIQRTALEQLSQAYSKGKPDMMEWKALQSAMPAQLQQIAKEMKMTETQLGEGLRNGKVSMSAFMDTIIRLNENGANGFQSFAEQAKNATGGFATSIANMKTSVTRGVANMITTINTALENSKLPTIQIMLNNFGGTMENILSNIGNFVGNVITLLSPILNIILQIGNFVKSHWSIIQPILQAIIIVLGVYYTYTLLARAGTWLLTNAMNALRNPTTWIMIVIIAIIAVLIYFWNTSDEVAYWILYAWDALVLGAMALKLGVKAAFYAIVLAGLYMYQGMLEVKLGLQTAFYMIQLGALSMKLGFQGVCQGIVNAVIWMYNKVAETLNKLGAHFEKMDYADFTSKTVSEISDKMAEYVDAISETYGEMEDVNLKIGDYQQKLIDIANNGATEIQKKAAEQAATREDRVANRKKLDGSSIAKDVAAVSKDILDFSTPTMPNVEGNTGKIADNTAKIADSLDTTTEDLKYIMDLAERDTINRFTTAEIKIDMTNNNNINSEMDIDGVISTMTEALQEKLMTTAEGCHA